MQFQEFGQDRGKDVGRIRRARVEAHTTHRFFARARKLLCHLQISEDAARSLEEGTALWCKSELPSRPIEKACCEPGFQSSNQLANSGRCNAHISRRRRKSAQFDHANEHVHLAESIDVQSGHDDFISQVMFLVTL